MTFQVYFTEIGDTPCYACGDPAAEEYRGKPVCKECAAELKHGTVRNQNINFFGGRHTYRHNEPKNREFDDHASPWQENSIRSREDSQHKD